MEETDKSFLIFFSYVELKMRNEGEFRKMTDRLSFSMIARFYIQSIRNGKLSNITF